MSKIFYKPKDGWAADIIPFYRDGEFRLFYLHDWRNEQTNGEGTPWFQISTKDFIHFTEHGEMLARGTKEEQDLYVFTGCVIEAGGQFHIFYTGHNPHFAEKGRPVQGVMHAVSDDLIHWTKIPEDTFFAPCDAYEPDDWRDPFIFWNEEEKEYWMLLAARKKQGPKVRRGCTALCASKDLKTWEVRQPLWDPELYFTHECPDLFKMGDWWYLIFSEFTDKCITRYRMSRSLQGPWIAPRDDAFDGRAFYAAKTFADEGKRYIFGWNPTKEGDDDCKGWQWGGNLVVHEVFQREDGTLGVRLPATVADAFASPCPITFSTINGQCTCEEGLTSLKAAGGNATAYANEILPTCCRLDFQVRFEENTRRFGIMLRSDKENDSSYCLMFKPEEDRVCFDSWPNHPWGRINSRGLERPLELNGGQQYSITIIMEDEVCEIYIDGQIALGARMYANQGCGVSVFVNDGKAVFSHVTYSSCVYL